MTTTTTFNTRRGARNHGGGVSIVTIVKGVLVLAVLFLLAFQYGLVREEDLGVLSSSLPSSSVRGGASNTVDNIKATSGTSDACPQASHLAKPIVLDFKEIKATDNQRLNDVKGFTEPSYEQWMLGPAGSEHHILTTPSGNKIFGATQFHNPVPPAPPTLGWLILELDMLRLLLPWPQHRQRIPKF